MDPIKKHKNILGDVKDFFDEKVVEFGATHEAADYNSKKSQDIRFQQLLKIIVSQELFSILDYGCGYGELANFMETAGYQFSYQGFDISEEMIKFAKRNVPETIEASFATQLENVIPADYTIACAIFNIRFDAIKNEWENFIIDTLNNIAKMSKKGFAFNMLTKYSDKERMREDLYYGDPLFYFDYCKMNFSRNVALLHDYELYDFTILVRL
jgi:SAM-dependent methyltransferase